MAKTPKAPGRPSIYTEALATEICARLSAGESVRTICADEDMPSDRVVFKWLASNEAFVQQYVRARETRAHVRFESIDGVMQDLRDGKIDAQVARVLIDTIKWQTGKELPKRYGDKIQAEHSGPEGGPIQSRVLVEFVPGTSE